MIPIHLVVMVLGLALLGGGGSLLVRGASGLALRLGVSPIVVGLTVVAFGTSTPELVVNLGAAIRGNTEIGFGNVVGSNTANIGLLLASAAVVAPIAIHRTLVVREIPMMILAAVAALVLGGGAFLGESASGYTRGDGLMLLLLFGVFLYYTFGDALKQRADPAASGLSAIGQKSGGSHLWILMGGGLLALTVGGELTIRAAVGIAAAIGFSETVIGLTVVAVGTSLPELATTLIAATRGQGDIAIGNVVGSNIYNVLLVWGLSVSIAPASMPEGGVGSLFVMTAFSLVLLPMAISQERLGRVEGILILVGYAAYVGWLATLVA